MGDNEFYGIYEAAENNSQSGTTRWLKSEAGIGEMNCYEVAPGIQISYNDLNMDSCFAPMKPQHDFLQIDHCLNGCYEFELDSGSVSYLGEGDLCVSNLCRDKQIFVSSRIPLRKYRGITVLLEMESAQKTLNKDLRPTDISLERIKDTLCKNERSLLIKSKRKIDHIFSEFTMLMSAFGCRISGLRLLSCSFF